MSITSKPCGGPLLAAAAALVQLLAANPDLASMPLQWTVDSEHGLTAVCEDHLDPGTVEFAEALARALGTTVGRTKYTSEADGSAKVFLAVTGDLGRVLVSFTGYALAADGGE